MSSFSSLSAVYTLKLYRVDKSLYSRAVSEAMYEAPNWHGVHVWSHKCWAERSSHLPHAAACAHALAAQHEYMPLTYSQQSHYLCFRLPCFDSHELGNWSNSVSWDLQTFCVWMLEQVMLAFIQKLNFGLILPWFSQGLLYLYVQEIYTSLHKQPY